MLRAYDMMPMIGHKNDECNQIQFYCAFV